MNCPHCGNAVQPEGKALGYCLLNNEGKMFWHEEGCVASDKESLDAWLESLTDQEPDDGWRIVPFYALQSTRQPEETPRDEVHGE